ncbi:CRISPR-associated protein Csx16 [uncultured Azohydromonas sp.]|uniref:CRISPR-associated protein Csx16 n=1 Tax=uncultured Azohydromonas sp. TaxID=487342 RepID=UPI0026397EA4|nr:CRISPR-associated protein Csx16 [uncultured Azohydromonas sp.]
MTRHPGAQQWLRSQGWEGTLVPHLEPRVLQPGDCVIGTVPLHLAAIVCTVGARYLHLTMEVPPELRGRELTPEQMAQCGARLEAFLVRRLPTPTSPQAR